MMTFVCAVDDLTVFNKHTLHSIKQAESWAKRNGLPKPQTILAHGQHMTQVYNYGMSKAIYPIKVFIHQDVTMMNDEWIPKLLHLLSDRLTGIVGLVGTTKLPDYGTWWDAGEEYMKGAVYCREDMVDWTFSYDKDPVDVVDVDGFFIATNTTELFDDMILGYQFYGMSYSRMLRAKGYKIKVLPHKAWHTGGKDIFKEERTKQIKELMVDYYERIEELGI